MSCHSFEVLSASVDGELPELEAQAVRAHIEGCAPCRSLRDKVLTLRNVVREAAGPALVPDSFRKGLDAAVRKRRVARRRVGSALGIALAAAAIVVVLGRVRTPDLVPEMVGDHVDITVKREEPFDVVGSDPAVLARSFEGRIDFSLRIPSLPSARLVGARLCNIRGRLIPLASYDRGGRVLSLFVSRAGRGSTEPACRDPVGGYTVCGRVAGGIDYTLISDYPETEAKVLLAQLR